MYVDKDIIKFLFNLEITWNEKEKKIYESTSIVSRNIWNEGRNYDTWTFSVFPATPKVGRWFTIV